MKKLICILIALSLSLVLFGCSGKSEAPKVTNTTPTVTTEPKEDGPKELGLMGNILEIYVDDDSDTWSFLLNIVFSPDDLGQAALIVADKSAFPFDEEHYYVDAEMEIVFTEYEESDNDGYDLVIYVKKMTNMAFAVYKPVIYLYPEATTTCSVALTVNGRLTCTYPEYKENGWEGFTAMPDGTLIFPDGKEYYALYWEGVQYADWDFSVGYCIKGEDTAEFLEWALTEQGLSRRELNEFIIYWLPIMQNNPYNVISFQKEAYTDGAILDISPAPDSLLRVFMTFYASETEVDIAPQSFEPFTRTVSAAIEYMKNELSSEITLKSMAKHFSVSEEHLSRIFKKETGVGFSSYLTFLRMKKAEELLIHSSESRITEIAYACGFSDSNYFSSQFKKIHGISPKKFQKNGGQ